MSEITRRVFLKLTAVGGAAAAADAVSKDYFKLIPYLIPPETTRPGVWSHFATTCRECPAGCGMRLYHCDGRVTKAEGNPAHPVNAGGLCPRGQSCVQGLYDPDRVKSPRMRSGEGFADAGWADALEKVGARIAKAGGKVLVISDLQTGCMAEVLEQFAGAFGGGGPLYYEPFNYEPMREANRKLFGMDAIADYRVEDCHYVLSLGCDYLEVAPSPVRLALGFAQMHSLRDGGIGRFAYVGPRLSMTAANADDFLMVRPGAEGLIGLAMVDAMIRNGLAKADTARIAPLVSEFEASIVAPWVGVEAARIVAMARAFAQPEKISVALGGPAWGGGPAGETAATAAALLNYVAGRVGRTVDFSRPHALARAATHEQTRKALEGLTREHVCIILNANPAFSFGGAAEHIRRAGTVVCLGTMLDETAALADWVLPVDSPLESWGDYEPSAGVHSLLQPTMARLYDTRSAGDILMALAETAGKPLAGADGFEARLRGRWEKLGKRLAPDKPFEDFWRDCLRAGGAWETPPAIAVKLQDRIEPLGKPSLAPASRSADTAELWRWPSIFLFDGRHANRSWLQEVPDPMSFATWGTWVDIHPRTAAAMAVAGGDVIELRAGQGVIEAPARLTEHIAAGVVAVGIGQGHTALGRNAAGRGANAFMLPDGAVTVRKTGRNCPPAYAADTQLQHGREIIQWIGLGKLRDMQPGDGDKLILPLPEGYRKGKDIYPPHEYKQHRWAMVVDLQRCIGCGACAVACYAENNLAVVGEAEVRRRLQMPWLQVVPYQAQDDPARVGFLPLFCQQCDAAPCEPVCPVFASVHNEEGLNMQVFNRCIGTRYCSHNCPYKVRRFNWLNRKWEKPLDMQLNPEVTVRDRGVMEKCTFCIQRIRQAQHVARREGRAVRDDEIAPACAQSCPTRAYIFGDLLDEDSKVNELTRRDPRRYHVLEELNTKPAVTYLRRIRIENEKTDEAITIKAQSSQR